MPPGFRIPFRCLNETHDVRLLAPHPSGGQLLHEAMFTYRRRKVSLGDQIVTTNLTEIIFFGRLEERKGLVEFLAAVTALPDDETRDFSVTFVGKEVRLFSERTGRVSSGEYIRQKLAGLQFPFRLLPDFSSDEAIDYVRASPSRVVCLPSPSDNFPNTGLEMAQIPAPLVVSDTTGFHQTLELVGRREGVFWFKPGSAESLRTSLREALSLVDMQITVPTTETIRSTNEKLAENRFELIEEAFAANRPTWLSTDWLARVFLLADGNPRAVGATLHSLAAAAGNITDITVLAMADWSEDALSALQKDFPQVIFSPSADLHGALENGAGNPAAAACRHLLLVCAGTTLQPAAVRNFLEAEARTSAVMVTAAEFAGPRQAEIRSFQPGSVPLLLRANHTSGACVLVSRPLVESLPPFTARTSPMLIWQATLGATATGQKIAYIPYPQYATAETATAAVEQHLALLSRYAAAIDAGSWCRREIFALALSSQQLAGNLRQARTESGSHLHEWRSTQIALQEARDHLGQTQAQLANSERHAAQVRSELAAVYASKSWRMTAPLRLLLRALAAVKSRF